MLLSGLQITKAPSQQSRLYSLSCPGKSRFWGKPRMHCLFLSPLLHSNAYMCLLATPFLLCMGKMNICSGEPTQIQKTLLEISTLQLTEEAEAEHHNVTKGVELRNLPLLSPLICSGMAPEISHAPNIWNGGIYNI